MRASEIREMPSDEILDLIKDLREELFNLRYQSAREPLNNPAALKLTKKNLARALTTLRERGIDPDNPKITKRATGETK